MIPLPSHEDTFGKDIIFGTVFSWVGKCSAQDLRREKVISRRPSQLLQQKRLGFWNQMALGLQNSSFPQP